MEFVLYISTQNIILNNLFSDYVLNISSQIIRFKHLIIYNVEYSRIVQVCIIYKDYNYILYMQQGENSNLTKLKWIVLKKLVMF